VLPVRHPDELTEAFRSKGLKITPQRQLLFRLLHDNDAHPTADALFAAASERMPGISRRTVYQTLNDLAEMGELHQLSMGGAARFDPNVDHHHHAHCTQCGSLRDVYVTSLDSLRVDGFDGFTTSGASIVFSGLCAACQSSNCQSSNNPPKEQHP
jgi:Fe2+ or Zn2+ uptake regulation protein